MQLTGPWPIHLAQELLEQRKCTKCLFFSSLQTLPSNLAEDFSQEGSMPAPSVARAGFVPSSLARALHTWPKRWACGQVGEVERGGHALSWCGGIVAVQMNSPSSASVRKELCPPYCTNLMYSAVTLTHGRSWHTDAIHILRRGGTEHKSWDGGLEHASALQNTPLNIYSKCICTIVWLNPLHYSQQ